MSRVFGFTDEEVKLLLVAVRQMRRTFAAAEKAGTGEGLEDFAARYDRLHEKLLDMAGPLPENLNKLL